MFFDSLGNRYDRLPPRKANPGAKPTKKGEGKFGRSKRRPRTGKPCGCEFCR